MKQHDFIELNGIWHLMCHHKGNTELISDKMAKEIQKRSNAPREDFITMEELLAKVAKAGRKKK